MIKHAFQLLKKRLRSTLLFRYIYSTIPPFLNQKYQALNCFLFFTAKLVLDLVRNPKDRFSHDAAQ